MPIRTEWPMRFGVFIAPWQSPEEDPNYLLHWDLELIERLDELGFDEAWIGEHHSGGWEIIADPMVFIAAAAQRTKHIRFGTGVSSLPYHHPFMIADRLVLLDHLTRGRVMFGVGPGQLTADARMMGIDPNNQRRMMDESLGVITALLRGETVTKKTDWFTIEDAQLQLPTYSRAIETSVAATFSAAGPLTAGRHGAGMLSVAATQASGFDAVGGHWKIFSDESRVNGFEPDRQSWRLTGPMHIAETEEQAIAEVAHGYDRTFDYLRHVVPIPPPSGASFEDRIRESNRTGETCFGTPEMARAQIQRLIDQSGGFGCFLFMAADFARPHETLRSYELFAREVAPHFRHSLDKGQAAYARARARDGADEVLTAATQASDAYEKLVAERGSALDTSPV